MTQSAPSPPAQSKKPGRVNTQAQSRHHGLVGWALPCQGAPRPAGSKTTHRAVTSSRRPSHPGLRQTRGSHRRPSSSQRQAVGPRSHQPPASTRRAAGARSPEAGLPARMCSPATTPSRGKAGHSLAASAHGQPPPCPAPPWPPGRGGRARQGNAGSGSRVPRSSHRMPEASRIGTADAQPRSHLLPPGWDSRRPSTSEELGAPKR